MRSNSADLLRDRGLVANEQLALSCACMAALMVGANPPDVNEDPEGYKAWLERASLATRASVRTTLLFSGADPKDLLPLEVGVGAIVLTDKFPELLELAKSS